MFGSDKIRCVHLSLELCLGLNTIKIVSTELESLTLIGMASFDDVCIHTPNLHSFRLINRSLKISKFTIHGGFGAN